MTFEDRKEARKIIDNLQSRVKELEVKLEVSNNLISAYRKSQGFKEFTETVAAIESHAIAQERRVFELEAALRKARSDIWHTACTNQGNINGVDLVIPMDAPCKEWIGNHFVHQGGINESLEMVSEIDTLLRKYVCESVV